MVLLAGCQAGGIDSRPGNFSKGPGPKVGVVLLHGKGLKVFHTIQEPADTLKAKGYWVLTPEMPWSVNRGYDAAYQDAMKEIHRAVLRLKKGGATVVIVGGHSMGANGALGYAARYGDIDGVMALAPGHAPELRGFQRRLGSSLQRALTMVSKGKGKVKANFRNINQGEIRTIRTTARIYLSYFDPSGPAVIPGNVEKLKKGIPLLWLVGNQDRMAKRGKRYAFLGAPEHPLNKYVVVNGNHFNTPSGDDNEIIVEWIEKVARYRR